MTRSMLSFASALASSSPGRSSTLERLLEEITPSAAAATRQALMGAARVRTFERGEVVLAQGQRASVGFVIEGVAAARRTTSDGRAIVPVVLGRGRIFGPMVLAGRETLFDYVGVVSGLA